MVRKMWGCTRTLKSLKKYKKFLETNGQNSRFNLDEAIKIFNYWYIVPNMFPYDAIAVQHDLLVLKREVSEWKDLNPEEIQELLSLREGYLQENYEAVMENMPIVKTIPAHFHLHLMVFKRREI